MFAQHVKCFTRKKSKFEKHVLQHPVDNVNSCQKYGRILLLPGIGHVEINLTKAVFKLMWDICPKELAIILGWESLNGKAIHKAGIANTKWHFIFNKIFIFVMVY